MNSLLVEFLFPSIIVTLLSGGILTVILRNHPIHSLLGLVFMGWTVVLLAAEVSARAGNAEGAAFTCVLVLLIVIHTVGGIQMVNRR